MNYNGSAADMKTILDFPPYVLSQTSGDGYRNSLPQMRQIIQIQYNASDFKFLLAQITFFT